MTTENSSDDKTEKRECMTLYEYFNENKNDLNNHDLSVLADWANDWKNMTPNPDWKKAYALIREGADLLLRRRARASLIISGPTVEDSKAAMPCNETIPLPNCVSQPVTVGTYVDYLDLRKHLGDWKSTFYGPHPCTKCGEQIIKKSIEQGGVEFDSNYPFKFHHCGSTKLSS